MWELLNTKSDFVFLLWLLPIFICFFGAISLFFLAPKTRSKRNLRWLLWMFFTCSTASLFGDYIFNEAPYPIYTIRIVITIVGTSPLMFIYLDGLILPKKGLWRRDIPWFVLAGIVALAELVFAATGYTYPDFYNWDEIKKVLWQPEPFIRVFGFYFGCAEFVFFLIRSIRIVHKYRQKLTETHSYTEKINLTWVYWVLFMMFLVCFGGAFYNIYSELFFKTLYVSLCIFLFFALYIFGFWQQEIPDIANTSEVMKPGAEDLVPHSVQLMRKIDLYFEEYRPFLNPQLTLNDIAIALQSNRTYVSRAINGEKQFSFYQYVNKFRIQHAVELLQLSEERKYTMETIAERSGFNSLTTFYHFFKQEKGCTPKQYMINRETPKT